MTHVTIQPSERAKALKFAAAFKILQQDDRGQAIAEFPESSLISLPRHDGLVQHRTVNAAWERLEKTGALPWWANRWMFLQDTPRQYQLDQYQLNNNFGNFGKARMFLGAMWTAPTNSMLGQFWLAIDEPYGRNIVMQEGCSFCADFQAPGREFSQGTWAKDIDIPLLSHWIDNKTFLNANPPADASGFSPGRV